MIFAYISYHWTHHIGLRVSIFISMDMLGNSICDLIDLPFGAYIISWRCRDRIYTRRIKALSKFQIKNLYALCPLAHL